MPLGSQPLCSIFCSRNLRLGKSGEVESVGISRDVRLGIVTNDYCNVNHRSGYKVRMAR